MSRPIHTGTDAAEGFLLTDLYQLNMAQAYFDHGLTETAVFEFFVRALPERRSFLMAAGLETALDWLENLQLSQGDAEWLASKGRFDAGTVDRFAHLRFTGDVDAMPEGTLFFPDEPILRVTAPLPEAQLVETRLVNLLHFQTLIASKAARARLAAPDKLLVDFGLRRAHGADAGLMAARASYIAGFDGTATVLAGKLWGVPLFGTMAHAFVQAFDDEAEAFEAFARSRPEGLVLLLDTYDTLAAARKVVALAPRLRDAGTAIRGVRLDSGDLDALSRGVRRILDEGGLSQTTIFASGGLDESEIARLVGVHAPIDGFGLGTNLDTSSDAPALDCAYKLQEYGGLARRKLSPGKANWPGRKQVWRRYDTRGHMVADTLGLAQEDGPGEALLQPVMRGGRRIQASPPLAAIRQVAAQSLERLPDRLRRLDAPGRYPVETSADLLSLTREVDARLLKGAGR